MVVTRMRFCVLECWYWVTNCTAPRPPWGIGALCCKWNKVSLQFRLALPELCTLQGQLQGINWIIIEQIQAWDGQEKRKTSACAPSHITTQRINSPRIWKQLSFYSPEHLTPKRLFLLREWMPSEEDKKKECSSCTRICTIKTSCNLCIWKQPLRKLLWHFTAIHRKHEQCHFVSWPCYNYSACKNEDQKEKSKGWPDLPLQNKWPELCWDPNYKSSIEMFLQFQVPAQNWKEKSLFVSGSE